jgi:hypothetical protein
MTVTVQSALSAMAASTERLREITRELVLTAVEDRPHGCQVHLVTVVHDAALDATAEAEQAAAALCLEQTADTAQPHADTPHAVTPQEVAHCQHHVSLLGAVLVRQLAAPELLNDLAALGREHGREVRAWSDEIMRRVQACQLALWTDVQPALLGYWQELADTTDRSYVSGDGR